MTEQKIWELLLKKPHDFPKLHSESASIVAGVFADTIYDTLELNSTAADTKRRNILKYLRHFPREELDQDNCDVFIETCQANFETSDVDEFVNQVQGELTQVFTNLPQQISKFYKYKNEKHRSNVRKLELIRKYDQEALDKAKFSERVIRNISYYETSDHVINKLVKIAPEQKTSVDITTSDYREKQIKFAYALVHLQKWAAIQKFLDRLKKYESLTVKETNFLVYLIEKSEHFQTALLRDFVFVYENVIIDLCTRIIQLENDKVQDFFLTLGEQEDVAIIKKLWKNNEFKAKIKSLLLDLYVYSYCNVNLLKFLDFLN